MIHRQKLRVIGYYGEYLAERFLNSHGYVVSEKNKSYVGSEIDLICKKDNFIVFVEVKYRSNSSFGEIYESIDRRKLHRLKLGIYKYLDEKRLYGSLWRLDAILIQKVSEGYRMEHYKDIMY
jgi:putative endonuclease